MQVTVHDDRWNLTYRIEVSSSAERAVSLDFNTKNLDTVYVVKGLAAALITELEDSAISGTLQESEDVGIAITKAREASMWATKVIVNSALLWEREKARPTEIVEYGGILRGTDRFGSPIGFTGSPTSDKVESETSEITVQD